jgi:hypothetical protein
MANRPKRERLNLQKQSPPNKPNPPKDKRVRTNQLNKANLDKIQTVNKESQGNPVKVSQASKGNQEKASPVSRGNRGKGRDSR